ncbi:MAG: DUF167 domain-containing protein [Rhodospirillales bacterium]
MAASAASPVSVADGGIRVAVRLTPRGGSNKVQGVAFDAEGAALLRVSVTAPPEDGKANAALVKLLAKEWRVAKSSITILSGHQSRTKLLSVRIAGDGDRERIVNWGASLA